MFKSRLLPLLSSVVLFASFSQAQTATGETLMLNLPRASQHAVVSQRIGITDITINYHRPLANGRQVWGKARSLRPSMAGWSEREYEYYFH